MNKKAVKVRRKGNKTRQRPRSFVAVNGLSKNASLNVELSKKLASLKSAKRRSDSDPIPIDVGKRYNFQTR